MSEKSFVVFSGSNDRAVLAFLRTAETCGHKPYIIAWTKNDRIFRTKYKNHVVGIRKSRTLTIEIFSSCINQIKLASGDKQLVILPSSEYFNNFLLKYRTEIEGLNCVIPLPANQIYFTFTDKESSTALFLEEGYSVPREYPSAISQNVPLVAKPRHNLNANGTVLYPLFLLNDKDISNFSRDFNAADFFFQELVQGESLYLLFYLSPISGTNITWSQKNILQQPSGKSMLFCTPSDFHNTDLAADTISMLRRHGFYGLGMIEFIKQSNQMVFIEMNPRPWGPMQLAIDNGVPILRAFIEEIISGSPFAPEPRDADNDTRNKGGRYYAWFGGMVDTLLSGERPSRLESSFSWARIVYHGLRSDVYLRRDSWRCFFYDMFNGLNRT